MFSSFQHQRPGDIVKPDDRTGEYHHAKSGADDVVDVHRRQDAINHFTIVPGIALHQPDDGQNHGEPYHADKHQPVLEISQQPAVKRLAGNSRQDVVEPAQGDHAGETQYPDVGMPNGPVVEVGDALHHGQRHHRSLEC